MEQKSDNPMVPINQNPDIQPQPIQKMSLPPRPYQENISETGHIYLEGYRQSHVYQKGSSDFCQKKGKYFQYMIEQVILNENKKLVQIHSQFQHLDSKDIVEFAYLGTFTQDFMQQKEEHMYLEEIYDVFTNKTGENIETIYENKQLILDINYQPLILIDFKSESEVFVLPQVNRYIEEFFDNIKIFFDLQENENQQFIIYLAIDRPIDDEYLPEQINEQIEQFLENYKFNFIKNVSFRLVQLLYSDDFQKQCCHQIIPDMYNTIQEQSQKIQKLEQQIKRIDKLEQENRKFREEQKTMNRQIQYLLYPESHKKQKKEETHQYQQDQYNQQQQPYSYQYQQHHQPYYNQTHHYPQQYPYHNQNPPQYPPNY